MRYKTWMALGWAGICGVAVLAAVQGENRPAAAQSAAAESSEARYLSNVRQLTRGFARAGEGYFSPDGKMIVYQAITREYPMYQIYMQPVAGGAPQLVSTGRGRTTCSYFSPDGKKILFASSHLDPNLSQTEEQERKDQEEERKAARPRRYKWNFDEHFDLFEKDLASGEMKQLTDSPGYDAEGAYSRDGKLIAFCSTRDGDPDLYVMHSDGSGLRQLTNTPGYDGGPFISPDAHWVVFRSDRKEKDLLQIYVIGIDGQHETVLTDTNGVNWGPYWHPTEPYLIWAGADHSDPTKRPNYDLWLTRYEVKDGQFRLVGDLHRVTDHETADLLPVFSPDGKHLMWTASRTEERTSQLFLGDFQLPK